MALHPKGKKVVHYIPGPLHPKWHYIQKATTSHKPLHPTMLLHPMYHFIPFATSSHIRLHPIGHFITKATSSYKPLHPIGHFIPWVTSSHISFYPKYLFIPYTNSSHIRHMICRFTHLPLHDEVFIPFTVYEIVYYIQLHKTLYFLPSTTTSHKYTSSYTLLHHIQFHTVWIISWL